MRRERERRERARDKLRRLMMKTAAAAAAAAAAATMMSCFNSVSRSLISAAGFRPRPPHRLNSDQGRE